MGIDFTVRRLPAAALPERGPRPIPPLRSLAILGLLASAAAAAPPAPPRQAAPARPSAPGRTARADMPPAPEVRVQGYRILVERISQVENLAVDFPPDGTGKVTGQQVVHLNLAVQAPSPKLLTNIEGLDSRLLAFQDGKRVLTLQPYNSDEENLVSGGMWRTMVIAQEVDLSASRLSRVQGELIIYPKAKLVTLDFPLDAKPPQVREDEALRATVKQVKHRPGVMTAVIGMEWPTGLSVSRVNPEMPYGISAITRAGAEMSPNGGGSSTTNRGTVTAREYSVSFSDVREVPAKLRVQLMVRSGAPRRLAFTLPDIPLPDTLAPAAGAPGAESRVASLLPGHPLYGENGGTLKFGVRRVSADEPGTVLIALAPIEERGAGPWRWLEAGVDDAGQAVLIHLKPGKYHVSRAWAPGPRMGASAALPGGPIRAGTLDVEIAAGRVSTLPALETGGL